VFFFFFLNERDQFILQFCRRVWRLTLI